MWDMNVLIKRNSTLYYWPFALFWWKTLAPTGIFCNNNGLFTWKKNKTKQNRKKNKLNKNTTFFRIVFEFWFIYIVEIIVFCSFKIFIHTNLKILFLIYLKSIERCRIVIPKLAEYWFLFWKERRNCGKLVVSSVLLFLSRISLILRYELALSKNVHHQIRLYCSENYFVLVLPFTDKRECSNIFFYSIFNINLFSC